MKFLMLALLSAIALLFFGCLSQQSPERASLDIRAFDKALLDMAVANGNYGQCAKIMEPTTHDTCLQRLIEEKHLQETDPRADYCAEYRTLEFLPQRDSCYSPRRQCEKIIRDDLRESCLETRVIPE